MHEVGLGNEPTEDKVGCFDIAALIRAFYVYNIQWLARTTKSSGDAKLAKSTYREHRRASPLACA